MEVKGINWVGSITDDPEATMRFFADVLGMKVVVHVHGFIQLAARNGDRLEVFGPESAEHAHLDTGPVAGFLIDDAETARAEMLAAGVDSVTEIETGPDGHRWFYFKAPDDNIYEIGESAAPRPTRQSDPEGTV